jgi:hypothetical protein
MTEFEQKVAALRAHHEELLTRKNEPIEWGNGIYEKYKYPVVTAAHIPLEWKYDFNEKDNPYLMQRIMCNAALNSGAIKLNGKYVLVVRVEGADRKSYFAVAESPNGIDNFRFWDEPLRCLMMWFLPPISTICALRSMRMAGSTAFSVQSAMMTRSRAISLLLLLRLPLPVRRI